MIKDMVIMRLPAQHILPIFHRLHQEASTAPPLTKLLQFVSHTLINSVVFPPECGSVYYPSVRTNNDFEGWHNRLNSRGRAGMNMYYAGKVAPWGIVYPNFNKSLQTGQVPNDWKEANVAPIFKKGDKHNPCNYRPISLTCIISKCMKPIIVSNIMQHLDSNKILYALQRLFADDCILYCSIKTERDSTLLQTDLNSQWELTWQTKFNIDKCYTMQAGRKRHTILNTYTSTTTQYR